MVQEATKKLEEQREQSSFKKALTSQTLIQPPTLKKIRSLSSSSSEEEEIKTKTNNTKTPIPTELTKKQKKRQEKKLRKKQLKE